MNPKPLLARFALAAAVCAPLAAQTPLFTDGPAFGGSKVFSEGMNPQGNPACFGAAPSGYYFTYLDGDQRAKDNKSNLADASSADPNAASTALGQLAGAPWALRARSFGFAAIKTGGYFGLSREYLNGMDAAVDLNPAHLGSGLAGNTSQLTGRTARVDRLDIGGGGNLEQGSTTSLGINLRVERWASGGLVETYNVIGPGAAFANAESGLMDSNATAVQSWNLGLDAGMVLELAQGVRLGLAGDQLVPKHLWDVDLQPQFRAGLQLDLGALAKLALEGDLNAVERMPLPVKQQSASASLRFAVGPATTLLLGVERRKVDSTPVTLGGITLQIRASSVLVAVGFQAGQDRPLKGATFMVD
jgi:hypothetical protein